MNRYFLLLTLIFLSANLYAQNKKEHIKEVISLRITNDEEVGLRVDQSFQERAAIRAADGDGERGLVTTAIDFASNIATKAIFSIMDNVEKSRTSTWRPPVTKDYFYDQPSFLGPMDPSGMQFDGFIMSRDVVGENGKGSSAFYIKCSLPKDQISNFVANSRFSLQLDTLAIDLSKVKAKYTSKKRISMEITVKFVSTWLDSDLVIHENQEFGEFRICMPNMKYDPENPVVTFSKAKGETSGLISGTCFFIPRSYSVYVDEGQYNPCWSAGEFEMHLTIKETTSKVKSESAEYMEEFFKKALPSSISGIATNSNIVGPAMVKIIKDY